MADIRNLLRIDQVAPASVSANPVEFTSAQFYGGGMDVAKAPTYVGRGNEELQYMALAEIAGGVQQGLNSFLSISQTLDKRTISKVESQWEEIDANNTLSTDEKITEFNKILNKAETPVSGNEWKSQFTRRVVKSWGADFSNEVAQNSFNKWILQNPERYGDVMGPQLIQEAMDEFIKQNPSLAGVPWVEGIFTQAQATFVEMESQRALDQAVLGQAANYNLTRDKQDALISGEMGADSLKDTDPIYAETLNMATGAKSFTEFKEAFDSKWGEDLSFIGLRIEDSKAQGDFILKSTGIRDATAKDIWELSRRMKTEDRVRRASTAYATASLGFKSNPTAENLTATTTRLRQILADQNESQQLTSLTQYASDVLYGLESGRLNGDLNFSQLPPAQKVKILEEVLSKELKFEDNLLPVKGTLKNIKTSDLVDFVRATKEGQVITTGVMDASERISTSLAQGVEVMVATGNESPTIEETASSFISQFSQQTGLPIQTVERLFVDRNEQDGTVSLSIDSPAEVINKLTPEERQQLSKIGLTPDNLVKIKEDFVSLLDKTGKAVGAGSRGTGSSTKLGINVPSETIAKQALIKDPIILQKARGVINDPYANPEQRQEAARILNQATAIESGFAITTEQTVIQTALNPEEAEAYTAFASGKATSQQTKLIENRGILTKVDEAYKTLFGKSRDQLSYFDDSEPVDAGLIDRTKWVDENGMITPDGRRIGLKLRLQASTIVGDLGYPGREEYLSDYRRRLEALSAQSIDNLTPSNFFSVLEMTKGFKLSKNTIGVFNDNPVMQNFMNFVATQPMPTTSNIAAFNNAYATALDVSLAAVTGSGSTDLRYSMGGDAGLRVSFYRDILQSGNAKNLGVDAEFGTSVVLSLSKELGLPASFSSVSDETKAEDSLKEVYELIEPLLPNGVPQPDDKSNKTVITVISSTTEGTSLSRSKTVLNQEQKIWSELTPDEKLQFYFNSALQGNPENVATLMKLPIILNGVIDSAQIQGSVEERFEGVKALFRAGVGYSEQAGASIRKMSPTFTFTSGRVGGTMLTRTGSSNTEIAYTSTLPRLNNVIPELQPETLRANAVQAMAGKQQLPNFDEIEDNFDSWIGQDAPLDRPDVADLVESDATELRSIVDKDPSERRGIEVGLDPTDQFVMGAMSLPATSQNIEYISSMFGLNLSVSPNLRLDSTPIIEYLSSSGQGVEMLSIIKDANLGAGSSNKVSFDTAFDTNKPVLLVRRGNNLVPYGIPGPFPAVGGNQEEISRQVRFVRTFKIIRDLQQGVR